MEGFGEFEEVSLCSWTDNQTLKLSTKAHLSLQKQFDLQCPNSAYLNSSFSVQQVHDDYICMNEDVQHNYRDEYMTVRLQYRQPEPAHHLYRLTTLVFDTEIADHSFEADVPWRFGGLRAAIKREHRNICIDAFAAAPQEGFELLARDRFQYFSDSIGRGLFFELSAEKWLAAKDFDELNAIRFTYLYLVHPKTLKIFDQARFERTLLSSIAKPNQQLKFGTISRLKKLLENFMQLPLQSIKSSIHKIIGEYYGLIVWVYDKLFKSNLDNTQRIRDFETSMQQSISTIACWKYLQTLLMMVRNLTVDIEDRQLLKELTSDLLGFLQNDLVPYVPLNTGAFNTDSNFMIPIIHKFIPFLKSVNPEYFTTQIKPLFHQHITSIVSCLQKKQKCNTDLPIYHSIPILPHVKLDHHKLARKLHHITLMKSRTENRAVRQRDSDFFIVLSNARAFYCFPQHPIQKDHISVYVERATHRVASPKLAPRKSQPIMFSAVQLESGYFYVAAYKRLGDNELWWYILRIKLWNVSRYAFEVLGYRQLSYEGLRSFNHTSQMDICSNNIVSSLVNKIWVINPKTGYEIQAEHVFEAGKPVSTGTILTLASTSKRVFTASESDLRLTRPFRLKEGIDESPNNIQMYSIIDTTGGKLTRIAISPARFDACQVFTWIRRGEVTILIQFDADAMYRLVQFTERKIVQSHKRGLLDRLKQPLASKEGVVQHHCIKQSKSKTSVKLLREQIGLRPVCTLYEFTVKY